ncbi:MAG: MFS transporter [Myxococcota bacterium]
MLPLWGSRRAGPLFVSHLGMSVVHGALMRVFAGYITANDLTWLDWTTDQLATLSFAFYVLPLVALSGPAGRLADRLDKAALLRWSSIAGIAVTGLGVVGWIFASPLTMLLSITLSGVQAALALPARYAIVAQQLDEREWVAGNASLLLGTLLTGVMLAIPYGDDLVVAGTRIWHGMAADAAAPLTLVVAAGLVAVAATFVPPVPPIPVDPNDAIAQDRAQAAPRTLVRYPAARWSTVLALTWYWAIGGMFLELLPLYVDRVLGAGPAVTAWVLLTFGVGTLFGTFGATALSRRRVELGLVPLGSLGLTIFLSDLWWIGGPFGPEYGELVTLQAFASTFAGLRISIDLAMVAVSGVLVAVPLISYLQLRSDPDIRGRILGANQRLNAIATLTGALLLVVLLGEALRPYDVLLGIAVANLLIAVAITQTIAEFSLRFSAWILSFVVYRLEVNGLDHIPEDGPAVLVANHVSYIDWLVIMAAVRRPIRFVMYYKFLEMPVMKYLFRQNKVIPIAGRKDNPEVMKAAFEQIHAELADGWLVLIFPEGDLTKDGAMATFRPGVERILERDPVPVIPMALNGLWGSFFSHKDGPAMTRPFRRVWSRVWVTVGPALSGAEAQAEDLQIAVEELHRQRPEP